MEDKLISFKTALLAKEKGFQRFKTSEEVDGEFNYYDTDGVLHTGYYKDGSGSKFGAMMNDPKLGATHSNSCEAPTQTMLQTWLRDEKKIFVSVSSYSTVFSRSLGEKNHHTHVVDDTIGDNVRFEDPYDYDDYGDAFEKGLQVALNYLKNGK